MHYGHMVILPALLALPGCNTLSYAFDGGFQEEMEAKRQARLGSFIGQWERDLAHVYGRADDVYEFADGGRQVTYVHRGTGQNYDFYCNLELTIDAGGRVTGASFIDSGNVGGVRACEYWL